MTFTAPVDSLPIDRRLKDVVNGETHCPFCGHNLVHHELPYRLQECTNRYMDRIPMWSETCNHHWELVIRHWKGSTEIYYAEAVPVNPKWSCPPR